MLLYGCVRQFLSIDKLLKNASLLGMSKSPTTPLYSDTTKHENFFDEILLTKSSVSKMTKKAISVLQTHLTVYKEMAMKAT